MHKKIIILILSLLNFLTVSGQRLYDPEIHIGQPADSVQLLVGREVQAYYNSRGWLMKMNAQTIDYKGTIKEVVLYKENILIPIFNKGIKCSIHFMMARDILSAIITQFDNLSLIELKQLMVSERNTNMSNYFFEPGYAFYNHIFTAENGLATIAYKRTVINDLPLNVREQLKMIAGIW